MADQVRISGCMITSGNAKLLRYSVPAAAPHVDELVIVEGAAKDWVEVEHAVAALRRLGLCPGRGAPACTAATTAS